MKLIKQVKVNQFSGSHQRHAATYRLLLEMIPSYLVPDLNNHCLSSIHPCSPHQTIIIISLLSITHHVSRNDLIYPILLCQVVAQNKLTGAQSVFTKSVLCDNAHCLPLENGGQRAD